MTGCGNTKAGLSRSCEGRGRQLSSQRISRKEVQAALKRF
jgi:hypothetical protein